MILKSLFFGLSLVSVAGSADAATFKCYASKYPADMVHYFEGGYTILDVSAESVNLKSYSVNRENRSTTLRVDANYKINGVQGGNGALKGMAIGTLVDAHSYPGDAISKIHFDAELFSVPSRRSGIIGKFAFPGHGFSYDWNLCYYLNEHN
jgi:hypothetical protein